MACNRKWGLSLADCPHLYKLYSSKKKEIASRLKKFKDLWHKGSEEDIFAELCFCLLTPQSKVLFCWDAIYKIRNHKLLLRSDSCAISKFLRTRVRFHNTKADYIVTARKFFSKNGKLKIRKRFEETLKSSKSPFNSCPRFIASRLSIGKGGIGTVPIRGHYEKAKSSNYYWK